MIISGHIFDLDHKPINNVKVRFIGSNQTDQDVYTNQTGEYQGRELQPKTIYEITPTLEGFEFVPKSVLLESVTKDEIKDFIGTPSKELSEKSEIELGTPPDVPVETPEPIPIPAEILSN